MKKKFVLMYSIVFGLTASNQAFTQSVAQFRTMAGAAGEISSSILKKSGNSWDEVGDIAKLLEQDSSIFSHRDRLGMLTRKGKRQFLRTMYKVNGFLNKSDAVDRQLEVIGNSKRNFEKKLKKIAIAIEDQNGVELISPAKHPTLAMRDKEVESILETVEATNISVITGNDNQTIAASVKDLQRASYGIAEQNGDGNVFLAVDLFALESDPNFMYVGGNARAIDGVVKAAKADPRTVLVIENIDTLIGVGDSTRGKGNMLEKLVNAIYANNLKVVFSVNNNNYEKVKDALSERHQRINLGKFLKSDARVLQDYFKHFQAKESRLFSFAESAEHGFFTLINNYYKSDAQPFRIRRAADEVFAQFKKDLYGECTNRCGKELDSLFGILSKRQMLMEDSTFRSVSLVEKSREYDKQLNVVLGSLAEIGLDLKLDATRSKVLLDSSAISKSVLRAKKLPEVLTESIGAIANFVDEKLSLMDLEGQPAVRRALRISMIDGFIKLKHGIADGPLAVLDFTGASGGGKTYTTLQVNELFFEGGATINDLVRINIGQADNVQATIAEIVEKMHANKNAIVVFDEADKNPVFLKGMMDLLDEPVTCINGKCVDFSQKPVVVISNFGANNKHAEMIAQNVKGPHSRFLDELEFWAGEYLFTDLPNLKAEALEEFARLNDFWRENVTGPVKEMMVDASTLGRMQHFQFGELAADARRKILKKQVDAMVEKMKVMEGGDFSGVELEISNAALDSLTYFSYSQEAGRTVRAFKRTVLPNLRVLLADLLADSGLDGAKKLVFDVVAESNPKYSVLENLRVLKL